MSEFLVPRTIFSFIYISIIVNKNFKKTIYINITKNKVKPLLIRMAMAIMQTLTLALQKHVTLTFNGIMNNTTPFLTMIMAFFMLGERIAKLDIILILICFGLLTYITIMYS